MYQLEYAKISDYYLVSKLSKKYKTVEHKFYSNFNENIFFYIMSKRCYKIIKKKRIYGLIFINQLKKELYYVPTSKNILKFEDVLNLLSNIEVKGLNFQFVFYGFNPIDFKSKFGFVVNKNYKVMVIYLDEIDFISDFVQDLSVVNMVISKDEQIRVNIQNAVFGNRIHRKELTISEVISEEQKSEFLADSCYFLKYKEEYIGYGQIVKNSEGFFLINFGILPEYRNRGYGKYFLKEILIKAKSKEIDTLYLKVENDNIKALKLYNEVGFEELMNIASITIF